MKIEKLPNSFEGKGEVKGYSFEKVFENEIGYVYQVKEGNHIHYESFKKKIVPICIDFEKRIYSETDFKEVYPKKNDFGTWAWTKMEINSAISKLTQNE
jgi:hypothetical protein